MDWNWESQPKQLRPDMLSSEVGLCHLCRYLSSPSHATLKSASADRIASTNNHAIHFTHFASNQVYPN